MAARPPAAAPTFSRPALAPALLAAVGLLACIALVGSHAFVFVRFGVTFLSLVILVFAYRGRAWAAGIATLAIAVCWNPFVTVPIPGQVWAALQIVAAAAFVAIGVTLKVPDERG